MTRFKKFGVVAGALALACVCGAAVVQAKKEAVFGDSAKAEYKDVIAGVKRAVLWGDPDKGAYGAFTKFDPGVSHAMHTHTNDIRLVVLHGAYVFKPQTGDEKKVGPGSFLFIPGGLPHASGGDAKEGVLFYEESTGKFDLNFLDKK